MIELPLLKPGFSGQFLMKLIIKVKMSNKRYEMFIFFLLCNRILFKDQDTKHLIAIFLFSLC